MEMLLWKAVNLFILLYSMGSSVCDGCNETFQADKGGFHSPNYPQQYPDDQYCSWRITVSPSHQVYLTFTSFNLQAENNTDVVHVYDGDSETGELLGVFYGGNPPLKGMYSSSNSLLVIFKSDNNSSDTGFQAVYHALNCSVSFLNIYIRSEGCDDPGKTFDTCGRAYIMVNGKDHSVHGRGHNVVTVDAATGAVLESKSYDTHRSISEGNRLRADLNAITGNKIVLVAVQDEGSKFATPALGALRRLGAKDPILVNFRGSFALAGYAQVNKPHWVTQDQHVRYKGPSEISLRILLQSHRPPPLGMENGEIADSQISASSQWDNNHAAIQGRLHFKQRGIKQGGWSTRPNNLNQWFQVDLGSFTTVGGIATQGRNSYRYRQFVKSFNLQYSSDGVIFQFYKETWNSSAKVFQGNQDSNTVVYNELNPTITTRYIRVRPLTWIGHISMRMELYGCEGCMEPLGMESGVIPDSQITASSVNNNNNSPARARLNNLGWTAALNDLKSWLQIDLGTYKIVTRVATRGSSQSVQGSWVTSYRLQYSDDGFIFHFYQEPRDTSAKLFRGNQDAVSIVYNRLSQPVTTHFIRILPVQWNVYVSMRVEIYGCQACIAPLGMERKSISDNQISASSQLDGSHSAIQARLNSEAGAWSPLTNDLNQWLQVDLGSDTRVTRVATQGSNTYNESVTKYKLQYSDDGVTFQFYKEIGDSSAKMFDGNQESDTVVYNKLRRPIVTRYIRILPTHWNNRISMRVELFGCPDCLIPVGMENGAISDSQISASSQQDDNYAPQRGRLNMKISGVKQGGWTPLQTDLNPWLQVNLGSYIRVTRVATQGRDGFDQWVTKYTLRYSVDEASFQFYREPHENSAKVFDGNDDSATVVYNNLNPPFTARYVRIVPVEYKNVVSMRLEIFGCPGCIAPLGMEDGAIPDAQITASSQWDDYHSPARARLNTKQVGPQKGGWSSRTCDLNQWLQVDLGSYTIVTRVATQGRNSHDQWVTSYRIEYGNDGVNFHFYQEPGDSSPKVFSGNQDPDSIIYNTLNYPITARYVRVRPVSWRACISMRMELYGCPGCVAPLGMEDGTITDAQITASSQVDGNHSAVQARLNFKAYESKAGAWSALTTDRNQWLQVDLGSYTRVTRLATQGRNAHNEWVTKYKLQYSDVEGNFQFYKHLGDSIAKVLDGNNDSDTIVQNKLSPPVTARYIRLVPVDWNTKISMRMEIYGCPACIEPLGMESETISDDQITASSQLDDNHSARQARLHFKISGYQRGGWSALSNDLHQWLQVDLGSYSRVTRVATQGRNAFNEWVTKYNLQYSDDGVTFHLYKEGANSSAKVFYGNQDSDTVVYNKLIPPVTARYIRLLPVEWKNHISMRIELYGCPGCVTPLGLENGAISDTQIAASSQLDSTHSAQKARLHSKADGSKWGSWSALTNDLSQWLQVDLSTYTRVTRLATQGRNGFYQWVTKYNLQYSDDGDAFHSFGEPGTNRAKVFIGNQDSDTVAYNTLTPPITARYVRFKPVEWYSHISMRIEIYGCPGCKAPLGMTFGSISDYQISASSQKDGNHIAAQGRLHLGGDGSKVGGWSPLSDDVNQWIQVDFGSYTRVTGVATQGRYDDDHWVSKYRLQYSDDGMTFQTYKTRGEKSTKLFDGNRDSDTVKYNILSPPITTRYIRITPVEWHNHISVRMELYGCPGCDAPLGMDSGAIPDSQITASSQWSNNHAAGQARLHFKKAGYKQGGWSARRNDVNQWLQVDFGSYTTATKVATQGSRVDYSQWVTQYRVQYSDDGVTFQFFKEPQSSSSKLFHGNQDTDTIVYNRLNPPITTRYIRLRPVAWHRHIAMRIEIFGCPACVAPLGMENRVISDEQIHASSQLDNSHSPKQARLHTRSNLNNGGGWSALRDDFNQWLEVDLGSYATVTLVGTQGRNGFNEWVTKYRIQYSDAGVTFQFYRKAENSSAKVFEGNEDSDAVVLNKLSQPITARYIRLLPIEWHNHISMRMELYGCPGCITPLGMESGDITNAQIRASSMLDGNNSPGQARLHQKADGSMAGAWSAQTDDLDQWLQVDLGSYTKVSRVATQGKNGYDQWVTMYKIRYSNDGENFWVYKEPGTSLAKVFRGNQNSDTVIYNILRLPLTARYIRFVPVDWHNHISMRIEIYGCPGCAAALGMENAGITDTQMSSSSQLDDTHSASEARLNFRADGGERGGWSALTNDFNQWLQVDLGTVNRVTRVATQGRNGRDEWVTRYRLQYSDDGVSFLFYNESVRSSAKVFYGNQDSDTIVYNVLNPPITARYILIRPVEWHNHISMRMEIYGCFVPTPSPTSPPPGMTSVVSMPTVEFGPEANRGENKARKGVNVPAIVVPVVLVTLILILLLVGLFLWKRKYGKDLNINSVVYKRQTDDFPTAAENLSNDRDVLLFQDS